MDSEGKQNYVPARPSASHATSATLVALYEIIRDEDTE